VPLEWRPDVFFDVDLEVAVIPAAAGIQTGAPVVALRSRLRVQPKVKGLDADYADSTLITADFF